MRNIVFLFISFLIDGYFAQDSISYYEKYTTQIIPRVEYLYKNQFIDLTQNRSDTSAITNSFSTGNQHFLGGDVSYDWFSIGYSFSLSPTNTKGNIDFRASTAYKGFQLKGNATRLRNLNYNFVENQNDLIFDTLISTKEQEIQLNKIGGRVEYVLNHKKYCYSAGFTQGGRQLKSAGSLIASIGLYYDNYDFKNLSPAVKEQFDTISGFNVAKLLRVDVGIGYGRNWVIRKHFTISFIEIPNIGMQRITTLLNDGEVGDFTIPNFTNQFRLGVLYTRKPFFIGASAMNSITASRITDSFYANNYTTVNMYIGWIFEYKGLKFWKK
jgi:Domain of unknown function (DUF4421)